EPLHPDQPKEYIDGMHAWIGMLEAWRPVAKFGADRLQRGRKPGRPIDDSHRQQSCMFGRTVSILKCGRANRNSPKEPRNLGITEAAALLPEPNQVLQKVIDRIGGWRTVPAEFRALVFQDTHAQPILMVRKLRIRQRRTETRNPGIESLRKPQPRLRRPGRGRQQAHEWSGQISGS